MTIHEERTSEALLPALAGGGDREALRFGDRALTYAELAGAAGAVAAAVARQERVAAWAVNELETAVAVVGALLAGVPVVPINPKAGERELGHIVADSAPGLVLSAPGAELPEALASTPRHDVDVAARAPWDGPEPGPETPALVIYTSGTTGAPKGVVLPRRAIASNLDALARAWAWTADDVLVHGLPLFHVHGLGLGTLGPLRLGGTLRHLGRFSSAGAAEALGSGATMLFGVPTMYHRLAADAEGDPAVAEAIGAARLLVSGSAALPAADHERIERTTGQRIVERYGMTETLITVSARADGERRPGWVGLPIAGVESRIIAESGEEALHDGESIGALQIRGPMVGTQYLGRPEATAESWVGEGWFDTGDVAVIDATGFHRIVGRASTDLIKTGGFRVGAGEIEAALLGHEDVREAAVVGLPDEDLGQRLVAFVVADGPRDDDAAAALVAFVGEALSKHKRPREIRFVDDLPRNPMGKVQKKLLSD